ncbi:NXPE family member 3 isoform X1 [Scleropages formosus]|uniref:Neurexophilin and PC-esterase domain family, member 3 n=1 Tax=Scleropages formosus TaxID=113540 RepID=A0A8C9RJU2_SCLFO|nr:NXPE family member 3 isoform X1 [Scleropages formosus]
MCRMNKRKYKNKEIQHLRKLIQTPMKCLPLHREVIFSFFRQKLNGKTVLALYNVPNIIEATFRPLASARLDWNQSHCRSLGLAPSPEEATEEHHLLESIAWPESPGPLLPLQKSSDPAHSFFTIWPADREWHVGDQLQVLVHMRDFQGHPKHHGGDFLLARLYSPKLGAGVAGHVVDHQNGLYSVLFWLPWEGQAYMKVTMVHSSEAVRVLKRLREERPDRVYFKSLFRSGPFSETTVCNLCLPSHQPLCNYTNSRTGEPWFCYKPKLLSCDVRVSHAKGGYQKNLLTRKEELLFQSNVNIKVSIPALGPDHITVLPESKAKPEKEKSGVVKFLPSGFYYNHVWQTTSRAPLRQFLDTSAITQCLQGKAVLIFGDSTARQWYEYLNAAVPDLKEVNLNSPKNVGPFMSVDIVHNILLKYRCHGPPIRFSTVAASQLHYIADELEDVAGGRDTVVMVSVWSHFSTFPVEVYIRRLRAIRRAILHLLQRAPDTLVIVRTGNPQALNQEVSLYNSDWFSLQFYVVLRSMFQGLNVVLVDAWEMVVAHHLPHDLHPPLAIIKNMINVILSHVCPDKS